MQKRRRVHIFRRQLMDAEGLRGRAVLWLSRLKPILKAWQSGDLKDAEFAALYLFLGLQSIYGERWVVGPHQLPGKNFIGPWSPVFNSRTEQSMARFFAWMPNDRRLLQWVSEDLSLRDFLRTVSLRGVRKCAREALVGWLDQALPIQLLITVPTAQEMLSLQTRGIRPVSVLLREEELGGVVHDGRDALSFMLHDLGHAAQFYSQPEHFLVHKKLYDWLRKAYELGVLNEPEKLNPNWGERLEYLISDLNTHPIHFLSVLRASSKEAFCDQGELWFEWWRRLMVIGDFTAEEQYQCWQFIKYNDLSAAESIVASL